MGTDAKIFVCCVNAYQRLTSGESSVDIGQPPTVAASVIGQWTHAQNGQGGSDGDDICAQYRQRLPFSKADLVVDATEYQIYPQEKSTEPLI